LRINFKGKKYLSLILRKLQEKIQNKGERKEGKGRVVGI